MKFKVGDQCLWWSGETHKRYECVLVRSGREVCAQLSAKEYRRYRRHGGGGVNGELTIDFGARLTSMVNYEEEL